MGHSCASGLNSNLTWNGLVVVMCSAFLSFMSYAVVTVTEFSKYRSGHMIEYFEALRYVRCFLMYLLSHYGMFTVIVDGLVTKVIQSNHCDHMIGTVTGRHLKSCLFLYQVYDVLGSLEIFFDSR